jgi:hypothetical protein
MDTIELSQFYLREMEGIYGDALAKFAIHAAMVAPAVVMKLPALTKLPGFMARTPKAFMRAFKSVQAEWRAARALEQAAAKQAINAEAKALWFTQSTSRLARTLDLLNRMRHKLISPFVRLGLAERWTHRTFFQRFYQNLSLRRLHRLILNVPGAAIDVFMNFPWSIMGYQWGNGLLATGFQAYSLYEMTTWIIHGVQGVSEAATEMVMERVHNDPESYRDLVDGMYDGEFTQSDLVAMIEMDDKLGAEYRDRSHKLVGEFYKALGPAERRAAFENFAAMERELDRQIKEEEKKPGFDPNKVRILRRTHRHVKRTQSSLAFFARQ